MKGVRLRERERERERGMQVVLLLSLANVLRRGGHASEPMLFCQ
jgi:hypothetical protein